MRFGVLVGVIAALAAAQAAQNHKFRSRPVRAGFLRAASVAAASDWRLWRLGEHDLCRRLHGRASSERLHHPAPGLFQRLRSAERPVLCHDRRLQRECKLPSAVGDRRGRLSGWRFDAGMSYFWPLWSWNGKRVW